MKTAGESDEVDDTKTDVGGRFVKTCVAGASLFIQRSDREFIRQLLLGRDRDGDAARGRGEWTSEVGC